MTPVLERTYPQVGERIDLTAPLKLKAASKLAYGQVEFIISNATTDRYGESVIMEGIDTTKYMVNPVVLWGHDYNALPLGRTMSLRREGGNLIAKVQFDTDLSEFADTVYQQILRGTISAASIGGLVKQYGSTQDNKTDWDVIAEMEMVEWSVVPVPANPEALVLAKQFGMDETVLRKQYVDFVSHAMLQANKVLGSDEITQQIQTLKNLTSALEGTLEAPREPGEEANSKRIIRYRLSTSRTIAKAIQQNAERIVVRLSKEIKGTQNGTRTGNN